MRLLIFVFFILPLIGYAQENQVPSVKIESGNIFLYLSSDPLSSRSLPAYKPGFVHIIISNRSQFKNINDVNCEINNDLIELIKNSLSTDQKQRFLEQYSCLILLNYSDVSILNKSFIEFSRNLTSDSDNYIRSNALLVVRMYEMYQWEKK